MKKKFILAAVIATSLYSCNSVRYVPVESTKIEYRDNFVRDSIFRYDSIFVKDKGDTVFFERYRYLYEDKIVRDSVFLSDTIRVPFPVEVVKQVKAPLTSWQSFQVWCRRILLVGVILLFIYFVLRLKKKLPL